MSEIRAGAASITIDGNNRDLKGELKYDPTSFKNERVGGQSGMFGHKRMPKDGYISAKIMDDGTLTVRDFQEMTDVTVVAVLANGKTVSGAGLCQTGEIEVDTEEGTFDVKFEGQVEEG